MQTIQQWLLDLGVPLEYTVPAAHAGAVLALTLLAWIADLIARRLVARTATSIADRTATTWDDAFVEHGVWSRLAHLAPALVVYLGAPLALAGLDRPVEVVQSGVFIYIILVGLAVIDAALNASLQIYQTFRVAREVPIKGVVQVLKIVLVGLGIIYIVALVIGRSPWILVSGLGAMTAVLLLIFKDSILGLVAGIQLAANRMVASGDWIEMPRYGADGDVMEVALTTVKVRNWDKTITTIPTYALISESFKNWRGMELSGGRRIKRAIHIDMSSVRFCDEAMLDRFHRIDALRDYLTSRLEEVRTYNEQHAGASESVVNGRRLTNIGTFRAYVVEYLRRHPMVHQDMTSIVRQLPPGPHGLPIEIYVFSRDQAWKSYEGIQADIFDHLLAVVPEFDLRVFQAPAGSDVRAFIASSSESG